jgi:hypothetical protein
MSRGFRRVFVPALAAVAAASAGACAMRKGSAPAPEPSYVVFTNQASDQAAVYARRGGGGSDMVRIGSVASGRTETLRVPVAISRDGSLSVVARLLARRGLISSGEFVVRPGERVSVTLGASANILTVLPIPQPEP